MAEQVTAYNPVLQDSPVNLYNTTAPGSPFGTAVSATQTLLLQNYIDPQIIRSFPAQFTDLAFMMSLPQNPTPSMEFIWPEMPYLVAPIVSNANNAGGPSPQSYTITAATSPFVGQNDKVMFPDGTHGIVTAKTNTSITVNSYNGAALPAVATGELIANRGPATADGVSDVLTTSRFQIAQYSNIIEDLGPVAVRFDLKEMKQWERMGTTDYVTKQMQAAYDRFLVGLQQTVWMSQYGTAPLTNGQTATATAGILQQQSNAGVANQPCTPSTIVDVMRQTIFDTALQGSTERVVFATRRVLNIIGTSQKAEKIRYRPDDANWNLDVYEYEFFGHKLILVPMDQWEDTGSYGNIMRNQVVMLNKPDLSLRFFEGFPMISQKYELLNRESNPGNLFNFKLVYWVGNVAPQLKRASYTGRFTVNGI